MPAKNAFPVLPIPGDSYERPDELTFRHEFADLSRKRIDAMSRDELIAVIRDSRALELRAECERRLKHFDHPTLLRLTYIIRRSFRKQGYGTIGFENRGALQTLASWQRNPR